MVIEVGHKTQRLKEPFGEFPYRWNLFLRSALENQHLDKLVSKVVFNLHETFKDPRRVRDSPPFCVREHGYGEFDFPIDIYFNSKQGTKYTINYFLELPPQDSSTSLSRIRKEVISFLNPDPEFRRLLIESGASSQPVNAAAAAAAVANVTSLAPATLVKNGSSNAPINPNSIGNSIQYFYSLLSSTMDTLIIFSRIKFILQDFELLDKS